MTAKDLIQTLLKGLPDPLPSRLGVAVSGGGDSVALLHLLAALPAPPALFVATVDHQLRPEAQAEARAVADICQTLDLPHETLVWDAPKSAGNTQANARAARYDLLTEWARRRDLDAVALGHTRGDQAETVLMRLTRAAGVTGLSAMRRDTQRGDLRLLRPLLSVGRSTLRDYLQTVGVTWIDDPSNDNTDYARIAWRESQSLLNGLGLTQEALATVADNMARAEDALLAQTNAALADYLTVTALGVRIDASALDKLPLEIIRRLFLHAFDLIRHAPYPPRSEPLMAAIADAGQGAASTLGGCIIRPRRGAIEVYREAAGVAELSVPAHCVWDHWRISGPVPEGCVIAALGPNGLSQCPDWRHFTTAPAKALHASPALWRGSELIAAPLARDEKPIIATHLLRKLALRDA